MSVSKAETEFNVNSGLAGLVASRQWQGRRYLISPVIDFLMVGGGGLVFMVLILLFVPRSIHNDTSLLPYSSLLAGLITYHVFAINYPHFAFSYQIAYTRLPSIRNPSLPWSVRARYLFALILFPVLYVLYCVWAVVWSTPQQGLFQLGLLVNLLFATVGWHYCKQSFGVLMVLSALKGFRFSKEARQLLLVNALVVWLVSWLGGNILLTSGQFWQVPYSSLHLAQFLPYAPSQLVTWQWQLLYGLCWVSSACVLLIAYEAWRQKKWPSLTGFIGYFMMYPLILIGFKVHPLWLWMVPAVHSLQYLLFATAYARNERATHQASKERRRFRHSFAAFVGLGVVIGAAQFDWIPRLLDAVVDPANKLHVATLFLALSHLFINIHHYFLDNVIWRKENPEVGRYLFGTS